jgi:hypothetical protein
MACSVPRQVDATYRALWTKVKTNAAARVMGHTEWRYRGLDQAPKRLAPTLTYQLGHDYGFKTGQQVSVLTQGARDPALHWLHATYGAYPARRSHRRRQTLV